MNSEPACLCPTNDAGDIRCHNCGERVNVKCWRCGTPRGAGPCPSQPRSAADHAAAAQRVLSDIAKCTEAPEQMIPAQEGHPVPQEPLA